jgi:hypothetical protein
MRLEDFHQEFNNEIRSNTFVNGEYELTSFTKVASQKLLESDQAPELTPCQFDFQLRNRKRVRIDGYGFDELENSIFTVVSDYSPSEEVETLTRTEVDTIFASLISFVETASIAKEREDLPHTQEAAIVAEAISTNLARASKIKLLLISNRRLSERVKELPSRDVVGLRADLSVWDLQRFHQLHESTLGREDLEVDVIKWMPNGLPVLTAPPASDQVSTYLAVVPGKFLADIFDDHGSRLLEGNVRSFLSARGNVNKGIRATILSRPDLFLPYNNGITATATSIEFTDEGKSAIATIRDLQIVNGGQTTASLYNYLKTEKEKARNLELVSVQMKLMVVSPDQSEQMVPDIARFANSQNKVSEADFFSNNPFHRRMEEISKRIWAPAKVGSQIQTHWFYERARGAYLNEKMREATASLQAKFEQQNPRSQVMQKTDFAKFYNSWMLKPHIVSRGAQKNFIDFAQTISDKYETDSGKSDFGDEFFKRVVCMKIMFEHLHKSVPKTNWYETGYLANIVAYALSRLSYELAKTGLQPNWPQIWRDQAISPELTDTLLEAARIAHRALTYTPRPQQNVTEWAKTEACWKICKQFELAVSGALSSELLAGDEVAEMRNEEKAKAKQLTEIEIMTKLGEVPSEYWQELTSDSRYRISPAEMNLLRKAQQPKGAFIMDSRQLARIVDVMNRAKLEGLELPGSFR